MQNSNLSSRIFPNLREEWLSFIELVSNDLQQMINVYNADKQRVRDLERVINKVKEIKNISKDNLEEILNYKELFMYIDNSLESSFDALNFLKAQNNLDNAGVIEIYERIINAPKIMKINSEYNSLAIKISFDKERIKRLSELIRGSKIDYTLIKELVNKYRLDNNKKKNILFYPVVMLSIRQNEISNIKDNKEKIKQDRIDFYHNKFNKIVKEYQDKKENLKDLLIKCFNVREQMSHRDIVTYNAFVNNPEEIKEYDFNDDIKYKIYTLAFFKIKKDIENFIDGISDLLMDDNDLDDELVFFDEMINEFDNIANTLKSFTRIEEKISSAIDNNVFFALNAFGYMLMDPDLLKNKSGIRALLQKANNVNNSKIDGVKTSHMLGISEAERLLGKNISLLTTSKLMLAYVMVGKNIFIITGATANTDRFDKMVNRIVGNNINRLEKQIEQIENSDLDYIKMQKEIVEAIIGEEEEEKTRAI